MTKEDWLKIHPFLEPMAALHAHVEAIAAEISTSVAPAFRWQAYLTGFLSGIPLLRNPEAPFDFAVVEKMTRSLVERLAASTLPQKVSTQVQALDAELQSRPASSFSVIQGLMDNNFSGASCVGLLRYFGWTVVAGHLKPLVRAFDTWSEREHWHRTYCPTCGSLPAMAQLLGTEPARTRLFSCGCCQTRWQYGRLGCPFCQNQDDRRLGTLTIEAEGGLRIDYCESCKGYLKTYCGQGDEEALLADWTSVHLDIVACDRGLKRMAASLYEI